MKKIWRFFFALLVGAALLTFSTVSASAGGCVALTFDDGPHKTLTPKLLRILARENVRATFYLIGRSAKSMPSIVRSINAGGHEIGNHSWNHANLRKLSNDGVRSQIRKADNAIRAAVGFTPETIRAPGLSINKRVRGLDKRPFIGVDVDPHDYAVKNRNLVLVANYVISHVKKNGDKILLHDTHATTVAAVPAIIRGLKKRGFSFCTVSQVR